MTKTRELTDADAMVMLSLDSAIQHAKGHLDEWASDFETRPAHAFEWSVRVFETAAHHEVNSLMRQRIEKVGLAKALAAARKEVMDGARFPHRSTSPPSDLMHQLRTSAWAAIVAEYSDIS